MSAKGQKRTSPTSFDHLVGAGQQRWRHGKAKRLGRLEVDHQFVFGWRLYRQIGRPFALEDAIDVASRSPERIDRIRPIGDQPAFRSEVAKRIDGWQPMPGRKVDVRCDCVDWKIVSGLMLPRIYARRS